MRDVGLVLVGAAAILIVYYAIARFLPDLEVPPPESDAYGYIRAHHRMMTKRQSRAFPWIAMALAAAGVALLVLG